MGASASMSRQMLVLKEFRKYESEFYSYLFGFPSTKDDISFYFIPKQYIIDFCSKFYFSHFSDELDNLIIYLDSTETKENKIIKEGLINSLNDRIDNKTSLEKIKNESLLQKYVSKDIFYLKFNQEGSFIPITSNIWNLFADYYGYDIILMKKGFVNEGEVFILTEEEKKIDCFFTLFNTKDLIYHYCFIMDNYDEYGIIINFFKKSGPQFSARYLIFLSKVDVLGVNVWQKFRSKIPTYVQGIGNYDLTIYFIDSYKFNNYDGKNYDFFQEKNKDLFQQYQNQNINIMNLINNNLKYM